MSSQEKAGVLPTPRPARRTRHQEWTRSLLWCGIVLGPLFYAVVIAQALTRAGYDITRHPVSLLSLGSAGWIQVTNFMVTGLLGLAFAAGVRRAMRPAPRRAWGAGLLFTFGVEMIMAGIFRPDALLGFPQGAPDAIPATMSLSAKLHGSGFFVAFASLTAACFVLARAPERHPGWAAVSTVVGIAIPLLIGLGMAIQAVTSIAFVLVGIVAFGWLAALGRLLLREMGREGYR